MTLIAVARAARTLAFGQAIAGAMTGQRRMTDGWAARAFAIDRWGDRRWGDGWANREDDKG